MGGWCLLPVLEALVVHSVAVRMRQLEHRLVELAIPCEKRHSHSPLKRRPTVISVQMVRPDIGMDIAKLN